ncbi:MAG: hypothetical protein JXB26_03150 [Candidatus Aminicenantes bacterium]|nr:hypothetical protein [Candidatus Aminicenantes bacterium]
MSKYRIKPLSPEGLKTYPLDKRKSKVDIEDFARPWQKKASFLDFYSSLPNILAGADFKKFVFLIQSARKKGKPVIFALGAHVIKVGLNPVLIDMMNEGWISAFALNGAGIIHDFELAYSGRTSEDVEAQIENGSFGMAEETGGMLNNAACKGAKDGLGLGEAVGRMMTDTPLRFKDKSLLYNAYSRNIPVTVHVALGTDIIHFHPRARGEDLGKTSLQDFFLFCSMVKDLEGGGVFINAGSAVVLPEVFLKAVSFVRNKGFVLKDFSTAVFDFIRHYRPAQNVVMRPPADKGRGFYFIGQHEILIPLLAAAVKSFPSP